MLHGGVLPLRHPTIYASNLNNPFLSRFLDIVRDGTFRSAAQLGTWEISCNFGAIAPAAAMARKAGLGVETDRDRAGRFFQVGKIWPAKIADMAPTTRSGFQETAYGKLVVIPLLIQILPIPR